MKNISENKSLLKDSTQLKNLTEPSWEIHETRWSSYTISSEIHEWNLNNKKKLCICSHCNQRQNLYGMSAKIPIDILKQGFIYNWTIIFGIVEEKCLVKLFFFNFPTKLINILLTEFRQIRHARCLW